MDYFIIDNEKIYIEINDGTIIFKKYFNGVLIQLNENEKNKILNELLYDYNYTYYSELLKNIMVSNPSLNQNFDYFFAFLNFIEGIIPVKYKANFYSNLKTLQIELNLDKEFSEISDTQSSTICGSYNVKENKIVILPESIFLIKEVSKKVANSNAFFWKYYNKDLLHELLHMASSQYDKESDVVLCGFDKYPTDDRCEMNRGLTEGMTEALTCYGIPGTIEISNNYYIEGLFINQLIQIIGAQSLIDSYFGNLGTTMLREKLCDIDGDMAKASSLFLMIELNYSIRERDEEQTILGSIQIQLVEYYSKKVFKDIENGVSETEIRKSMDIYKKMLVTNDILNTMGKNTNNYPNLNTSLEMFSKLEIEVEQLFPKKDL